MEFSPLNKLIPSWDAPTLQGFDTSDVHDGDRLRGSNRQFVRFYKKIFVEPYAIEVKVNEKTGTTTILKSATREVEKEMVEIITPGDKNIIDDVACDYHRREHWPQYKAFREGRTGPIGQSVDEATFISPHIATELKYHGCHTVEQLADASDLLCGQIANGWDLREYARAICKANLENKSLTQVNLLKGELAKSQQAMAEMQKQMTEMRAMLFNSSGERVASSIEAAPLVKAENLGPKKPVKRAKKAKIEETTVQE